MKKLLLSFAALLLCSLAHSQEAEETGRYAEFQLIPRVEFNPSYMFGSAGDGSSGYGSTFGNTSFYTLLEGAFSEHVSFTVSNHWVAFTRSFQETAGLYTSTLASNALNWLDILTFDFSFGNWTFTVGKDCISTGGFEFDEWDVDCDYLMAGDKILHASNLWYNLPSYQWGAKAAYTINDRTTLSLQMLTSPFGEYPFASGLFCYSGKLEGSYGPYSNIWSASAVQRPDGGFEWLVALSNKVEFADDFTFGFDWYNCVDVDYGPDDEAPVELIKGNTFRPSLTWAPSEKLDLRVQSNIYSRARQLYDANVSTVFHYYPMENFQVHAGVGYDFLGKGIAAMAGIKVNLTVLSL